MTAPGTISTGELMTDASTLVDYLADTARTLTNSRNAARQNSDYQTRVYDSLVNSVNSQRDAANAFVDALKVWADNEGVDSDFDDVLVRFGYDRRERDYVVRMSREVTYTQYATVTVSASDEDDARSLAEEDDDAEFETDSYTEYTGSIQIESVDES